MRKIAVVTGGVSGIGKAICQELIARHIFVIIADIQDHEGRVLEAELNKDIAHVKFVHLNVTDYKNVASVIHDVFKEFHRIDYLFNNAGIAMYGEMGEMTIEDWKEIMAINLWGVIYGTQIGYPLMKKQGFGHIVNTSSAAGLGPSPFSTAYATTKHAVIGLTTSLHYEAEEFGIKVSTLCPTFVDTPIFDNAKAIHMDKSIITKQLKQQKMISPQRIAKMAIEGVHQNKPIICPMPMRKTLDVVFTIFPFLHKALMRIVCKVSRNARLT